jgi:hypothetical protein
MAKNYLGIDQSTVMLAFGNVEDDRASIDTVNTLKHDPPLASRISTVELRLFQNPLGPEEMLEFSVSAASACLHREAPYNEDDMWKAIANIPVLLHIVKHITNLKIVFMKNEGGKVHNSNYMAFMVQIIRWLNAASFDSLTDLTLCLPIALSYEQVFLKDRVWSRLSKLTLSRMQWSAKTRQNFWALFPSLESLMLSDVEFGLDSFTMLVSQLRRLKSFIWMHSDVYQTISSSKGLYHLQRHSWNSLNRLVLCNLMGMGSFEEVLTGLLVTCTCLETLELCNVSPVSVKILIAIVKCETLQHVRLSLCDFINSSSDLAARPVTKSRKLLTLKIASTNLADRHLQLLLMQAPYLQVLDLCNLPKVTGTKLLLNAPETNLTCNLDTLRIHFLNTLSIRGLKMLLTYGGSSLNSLHISKCTFLPNVQYQSAPDAIDRFGTTLRIE